jgi:hypothetical protein
MDPSVRWGYGSLVEFSPSTITLPPNGFGETAPAVKFTDELSPRIPNARWGLWLPGPEAWQIWGIKLAL